MNKGELVIGIVQNPGGAKGGENDPWRFAFTLAKWKRHNGTIENNTLYVVKEVSKKQLDH